MSTDDTEGWMLASCVDAEQWQAGFSSREEAIEEGRSQYGDDANFAVAPARRIDADILVHRDPASAGEVAWENALDGADLPDDGIEAVMDAPTAEEFADLGKRLRDVVDEWAKPILARVPYFIAEGAEEIGPEGEGGR
jgi:hypothetical protein